MSSGRMEKTFAGDIAYAFIASAVAAVLVAVLSLVAPQDLVVRTAIAGLGLAFTLRTIGRSRRSSGGLTTMVLWACAAAAAWYLAPSLTIYVGAHVCALWLARSIHTSRRPLEAATDLAVSTLAICVGVWAAAKTGSFFLAAWSFGLTQALGAPTFLALGSAHADKRSSHERNDDARAFAESLSSAEDALLKIVSRGK